MYTLLIS